MRKLSLITMLLTVFVIVLAPAAPGDDDEDDDGGLVASAKGNYGFTGTAAGSTFDVRPFRFSVKVKRDGSVKGKYDYTQVRDGNPLTVKGSLTCAVIVGNRVWVGGVIEESSRASLIGLDMWFQAQNNGKLRKHSPPDMSTTIGAGDPGTGQQYCDDAPEPRFPFFIDEGDIKVKLGGDD